MGMVELSGGYIWEGEMSEENIQMGKFLDLCETIYISYRPPTLRVIQSASRSSLVA